MGNINGAADLNCEVGVIPHCNVKVIVTGYGNVAVTDRPNDDWVTQEKRFYLLTIGKVFIESFNDGDITRLYQTGNAKPSTGHCVKSALWDG